MNCLLNVFRFLSIPLLSLIVLLSLPIKSAVAALSSDYSIVCGQTTGKQPIYCNLSTHRCYSCTTVLRGSGSKYTRTEYKCINKEAEPPQNCKVSNTGGLSGGSDFSILGLKIKGLHDEGKNCITENFKAMYTSTCYSCEIVETLSAAFIKAAAKAYQVSREAANVILVVGIVLWIGLFVLKNISAFTAAEPMKMLQDILVQLFKVLLAFVIINIGISTILDYTLVPIMNAGTDFADTIIAANTGIGAS